MTWAASSVEEYSGVSVTSDTLSITVPSGMTALFVGVFHRKPQNSTTMDFDGDSLTLTGDSNFGSGGLGSDRNMAVGYLANPTAKTANVNVNWDAGDPSSQHILIAVWTDEIDVSSGVVTSSANSDAPTTNATDSITPSGANHKGIAFISSGTAAAPYSDNSTPSFTELVDHSGSTANIDAWIAYNNDLGAAASKTVGATQSSDEYSMWVITAPAAAGGAATPPGTPVVDIDTGNDGTFAAGDDKTADVRAFPGVSLRRGYNVTGLPPQPAVGRCQYQLDNSDGTYDDDAAHGVTRNDPTRVQHEYDSTTYNLWRGRIRSLAQLPNVDQQVLGIDALDTLSPGPNRSGFKTTLYTNITTDVAVGHVLDAMGVPSALGSSGGKLDTGTLTLPFFWLSENQDPFEILTRLTNAEGPKARLYVDGSGVVNFEANDYRTGTARSISLQETFRGSGTEPVVSRILRKEDGVDGIVNKASIPYKTLISERLDPEIAWSTSEVYAATTTATVEVPGSLEDSDWVFILISFDDPSATQSITSPNGWTNETGSPFSEGNMYGRMLYAKADAVKGTTVNFTINDSAVGSVIAVAVSNIGEWETVPDSDSDTGTDTASPADLAANLTVDEAGQMILAFYSVDNTAALTSPSGYTDIANLGGTAANGQTGIVATYKITTDGTDENPALTYGSAANNRAFGFVLNSKREVLWDHGAQLVLGNNEVLKLTADFNLPITGAIAPVEDEDFTVSAGGVSSVTLDQTSGTQIEITITAGASGATIDPLSGSDQLGIRMRGQSYSATSSTATDSDATSITAYEERGLRSYPTWEYIDQDDAQTLAENIVADFKDPRELVVFRVHGDRDDAALKAALEREISDRVRILTTRGGIDVTGWVERIDHRIGQRGFVTTDLAIWETV